MAMGLDRLRLVTVSFGGGGCCAQSPKANGDGGAVAMVFLVFAAQTGGDFFFFPRRQLDCVIAKFLSQCDVLLPYPVVATECGIVVVGNRI